nr:hypothetical protein CFP56_77821 [Quercus suber]
MVGLGDCSITSEVKNVPRTSVLSDVVMPTSASEPKAAKRGSQCLPMFSPECIGSSMTRTVEDRLPELQLAPTRKRLGSRYLDRGRCGSEQVGAQRDWDCCLLLQSSPRFLEA